MATTAGPREPPKPGKASQPPYPPSHSPLIGTHSVLFFWPWSSLQTQKQLQHQESSALSQETIYRQMCLASSTYCEFSEVKALTGSQVRVETGDTCP